jgi:hypothetical protein
LRLPLMSPSSTALLCVEPVLYIAYRPYTSYMGINNQLWILSPDVQIKKFKYNF